MDRCRAPVVFVPLPITETLASDSWSGPTAFSLNDPADNADNALKKTWKKLDNLQAWVLYLTIRQSHLIQTMQETANLTRHDVGVCAGTSHMQRTATAGYPVSGVGPGRFGHCLR